MGNRIGKEMLSKLQEIMRSKPKLISLCGIADDATEADLSGLNMDADDAIVLASELPDKGALTSLNISNNGLSRGAHDGSIHYTEQHFTTDTTGNCAHQQEPLLTQLILKVLSPLPALSRIWGHYRR
jgi:hypothetical protein